MKENDDYYCVPDRSVQYYWGMTNNELTTHRLANYLMEQHGLLIAGWRFKLNNNRSRLGVCRYSNRSIELSTHHVASGDWAAIRNTILHEIAHALVGGGHGHDEVWRRKAIAIGCNGQRCGQMDAPAKYTATCSSCNKTYKRNRLAIQNRDKYWCLPCNPIGTLTKKYLVWNSAS